jgi:hypothetical protein
MTKSAPNKTIAASKSTSRAGSIKPGAYPVDLLRDNKGVWNRYDR